MFPHNNEMKLEVNKFEIFMNVKIKQHCTL